MEIHNIEEAKNIVVEYIKSPVERKDLIAKCVKHLDLSDDIMKDKRPDGLLNKNKCLFGNAITELIKSGVIVQEDKILKYKDADKPAEEKVENAKRDIKIEAILFEILKGGKIKRKELLEEVVSVYNSTQKEEKVLTIKADAGRLLSIAVKNGKVVKESNGDYSLFEPAVENIAEKNKRLFYELGDEELVDKTVLMLEQWYKNVDGYTDLKSYIIDGPDDGGIDGIIKGFDRMGVPEKIIIQVKKINSKEKYVPLCEVREFYGVFATESDATKALFVTNNKYHKGTKIFFNKTRYMTLIDGERWLQLADQCGFELQERQTQ